MCDQPCAQLESFIAKSSVELDNYLAYKISLSIMSGLLLFGQMLEITNLLKYLQLVSYPKEGLSKLFKMNSIWLFSYFTHP